MKKSIIIAGMVLLVFALMAAEVTAEEINGCVSKLTGNLRVVENSGDCKWWENELSLGTGVGEQGPPGADGADGADGAPGADGADGADGAPGADGADGADGASGPPGADGADGADGASGPPGADGADGADGAPGPPGADGADVLIELCELYTLTGNPLPAICDSTCGNGIVEYLEECDDGNIDDWDGCNSDCELEFLCGNGVVDEGEVCDCNNPPCSLSAVGHYCNDDCNGLGDWFQTDPPVQPTCYYDLERLEGCDIYLNSLRACCSIQREYCIDVEGPDPISICQTRYDGCIQMSNTLYDYCMEEESPIPELCTGYCVSY